MWNDDYRVWVGFRVTEMFWGKFGEGCRSKNFFFLFLKGMGKGGEGVRVRVILRVDFIYNFRVRVWSYSANSGISWPPVGKILTSPLNSKTYYPNGMKFRCYIRRFKISGQNRVLPLKKNKFCAGFVLYMALGKFFMHHSKVNLISNRLILITYFYDYSL